MLQMVACGQETKPINQANNKKDTSILNKKIGAIKIDSVKSRNYYANNKLIKRALNINEFHPLSILYSMKMRENTEFNYEKYEINSLSRESLNKILLNVEKLPNFSISKIRTIYTLQEATSIPFVNSFRVDFRSESGELLAEKSIIEYTDNTSGSIKYLETSRRLVDITASEDEIFLFGRYFKDPENEGTEATNEGMLFYNIENNELLQKVDFNLILKAKAASVNKSVYIAPNYYYLELCDLESFKKDSLNMYKKILINMKDRITYEKEATGCEADAYSVKIVNDTIMYDFMRNQDFSENFKQTFKQIKF